MDIIIEYKEHVSVMVPEFYLANVFIFQACKILCVH